MDNTKNDSYQNFAKDNIVIGPTNLLKVVGRTFILLPLLTKRLGAYDYGIGSQANVKKTISNYS